MNALKYLATDRKFKPHTIFCIGRNYVEHAREMKAELPSEPVVFFKPLSALLPEGGAILYPSISKELHQEVELVVALGRGGRNIPEASALDYVAGYAVGLDMTLRDLQSEAKRKGLPWAVSKGFDTSAPISDILPASDVRNPREFRLRCSVNGILRQEGAVSNMIFSIEKLIEYLSSIFTLSEGDLIFTGTPEGVGPVKPGDRIDADLIGYMSISHTVIAG